MPMMMDGEMQSFTLTLDKLLAHAAKWHPRTEVVTRHAGGVRARVSYADLYVRSLRVSRVFESFGVQKGDRVATLAWNTQAHLEVWYAIMGMGAVCHTLNPRLTCSQLAAMVTQSEARVLVVSAGLMPLARQIAERARTIERLVLIDEASASLADDHPAGVARAGVPLPGTALPGAPLAGTPLPGASLRRAPLLSAHLPDAASPAAPPRSAPPPGTPLASAPPASTPLPGTSLRRAPSPSAYLPDAVSSAAPSPNAPSADAPTVCALERLIANVEGADAEGADAERRGIWGDFPETAPCGLCFTSGTTGAPKGVTYTHRSSFLHTLRILQADVMAITAADSVLTVVPMFHANAWGVPFAAPAAGAKLVLPGREADGASLATLINEEAVTIGVGVATVWLGLVEHLEANGGEVPTLKRLIVGGAPLPQALMERIERRLGATIQTSWGMTELSPSGTVSPPDDPSRSAVLSGRPAVGVDLLLTDAAGRALPEQRGVEGHLRVRGATVIERYFGEDQRATDADGWFPTGDLARIDADGNLIITGRAKDLIKSGGEWINPVEIEAIVSSLPEVSLAAVIGRPHPKWGERPILLVQTRGLEAVSDEALLAPLRGNVAPWWIPDAIIRLPRMPLASTGKIDKMRLKAEYGSS